MQTTDLTPTGPAAFGVIAERFRRAGQPDKAVALCREGLEKFPDHLSARVTLGWSLLDMGEHQEAFDQLKSVLKRAPDNLAAIRGLAELHERGIGLVFDSLSEPEPEPEPQPEPLAVSAPDPVLDDLDPIMPAMEADEPVLAAAAEPVYEADPLDIRAQQFEIEDVVDDELPGAFDLSGFLDPEPEPARVPLALRDNADVGRVDELHDWLARVRDRRSHSVSQYMAG